MEKGLKEIFVDSNQWMMDLKIFKINNKDEFINKLSLCGWNWFDENIKTQRVLSWWVCEVQQ